MMVNVRFVLFTFFVYIFRCAKTKNSSEFSLAFDDFDEEEERKWDETLDRFVSKIACDEDMIVQEAHDSKQDEKALSICNIVNSIDSNHDRSKEQARNGNKILSFCDDKNACFVGSPSDGDFVNCCENDCGKEYHVACLQRGKMFPKKDTDNNLIKCRICMKTFHRVSARIPAESEMISVTEMICPHHQLDENFEQININHGCENDRWMQNKRKPMPKNKPPSYRQLKANKIVSRFSDNFLEFNKCKCRPDDPAPCTRSNCYNAAMNYECNRYLCPAKENCQIQNLQRGEQFKFRVENTKSKGWGLFADEKIPAEKFVIEYKGEVIDKTELEKRFERSRLSHNFYFIALENGSFIDASIYGNESRFINHSCEPNVAAEKWTVWLNESNDRSNIRIGFFTLRNILPVCIV